MDLYTHLKKNEKVMTELKGNLEDSIFSVALLKKLKIEDITNLNNKIKSQKMIYFAKRLGVAPNYNFNLYWRGPYSPDLTKTLYVISDYFDEIEPFEPLSEDLIEIFNILNSLNNYELKIIEIAATIDILNHNNLKEAITKTKELKKCNSHDIEKALKLLNNLGLYNG